MGMRLHELHAAVIHAPLALVPTAAALDLVAAISGDEDGASARVGRALWGVGAGAALFAGLAGFAASQEVKADDPLAQDMMLVHGAGNLGLTLAAIGVAAWRATNGPSLLTAAMGLVASMGSVYTAYLGGELVYGSGVGVKALTTAPQGVRDSPPLLSPEAPRKFVTDAVKGVVWLVDGLKRWMSGAHRPSRQALGFQAGAPGVVRPRYELH